MSGYVEIRALSKILFGSAYRLEVAAAIAAAAQGVVTVGEVAEVLGVPGENGTVVRKELENFSRAGLLVRLPRPRGERIQRYERVHTGLWDMALAFLEEVAGEVEPSNSRT